MSSVSFFDCQNQRLVELCKQKYSMLTTPELKLCFRTKFWDSCVLADFDMFLEAGGFSPSLFSKALSSACISCSTMLTDRFKTFGKPDDLILAGKLWNEDTSSLIQMYLSEEFSSRSDTSGVNATSKSKTPEKKLINVEEIEAQLLDKYKSTEWVYYPFYDDPSTCYTPNCKSCRKLFMHAPLSKCSKVHPGYKSCVDSGWYPHVPIGVQKTISKHHKTDDDTRIRPWKPVLRKGQLENPLAKVLFPCAGKSWADECPLLEDPVPIEELARQMGSARVRSMSKEPRSPTPPADGARSKSKRLRSNSAGSQ